MGKYLQMLVAYSIHKEKPDRVTEHFERFNKDFRQVCEVFKEVTHQEYKPGQEVKMTKPMAPVKPMPREPKAQQPQQQTLSDQEQVDLQEFLGRHQLQELLPIFMREGITLEDVMEMTEKDMKEVGMTRYGPRKRLLGAVREERGDSDSTTSGVPLDSPEEQAPAEVVGPAAVHAFAEDMQTKCQLNEVQSSSSR